MSFSEFPGDPVAGDYERMIASSIPELEVVAGESRKPPVVRAFSSFDSKAWDDFVRREHTGTFFHLSGWMRVIEKTFGYSPSGLVAERDGRITGVLPLSDVSNWVTGRCLISSPFAVYGGILAGDPESYRALLDSAKSLARAHKVQHLELRNAEGIQEEGFCLNSRYVTFVGELASSPEQQLKSLPKDTRYMIRKGQKSGLTCRRGADQLDAFYELFAMNLKRHGTPMFPRALLTNLMAEFPGQVELHMAYSGEKAVSGVFTFLFGDTVLPYYSGANEEAPALAANNFLYWKLMEWACTAGFRRFDFGRSKKGTGAYVFKNQWNMRIVPLPYQIFLVERKSAPDLSPANPLFARATRVWSRLPLWLTKRIGPPVVRWFP